MKWMTAGRRPASSIRRAGLLLVALLPGCSKEPAEPSPEMMEAGARHFATYCAACHHPEGLQTESRAPPLAGSSWVAGSEERMVRIVLHGLRGTIEVAGQTYNLEMPGFGGILGDTQIAELLTYARTRYGGVKSPVTPETVSRVRRETRERTTYWTVEELMGIRR